MPRIWPLALVMLLTSCSGSPMPPTGMQPTPPGNYGAQGYGTPNGMDGGLPNAGDGSMFDESLNRPLQGGAGMGQPGLFGQSPMGLLGQGAPSHGGGLSLGMGLPPDSGPLGVGASPTVDVAPPIPAASQAISRPEISTHQEGQRQGHPAIIIASHVRTDPGAVRIKASRAGDKDLDFTMTVPMTGDVALKAQGSDKKLTLDIAGVATARMRLTPAGDGLWKPAGMAALTGRTTGDVPFQLTTLTIAAAGQEPWVISDPAAIMTLDSLPNIKPGTRVTVTVTLRGDTSKALPFLVANGKLMHLTAQDSESGNSAVAAAGSTYSRTFTLTPFTVAIGKNSLSKDTGMIGVKVIDLAGLGGKERSINATSWAVCFPSQSGGQSQGFAPLTGIEKLQAHVKTLMQGVNQLENLALASVDERPGRQH